MKDKQNIKYGLLNKFIKRFFTYTLFLSIRRLERIGIHYFLLIDPDPNGCGYEINKAEIIVTTNPKSKGGDFHA